MGAHRGLRISAIVYGVGLIFHTADHVRRGAGFLSTQVQVVGAISTVIGIGVVVLVLKRHRSAPLFAAAFGPLAGLGAAAAHLLPRWSSFSDSFIHARGTGVTSISWISISIEVAGAIAMGIFGWLAISQGRDRKAVPIGG